MKHILTSLLLVLTLIGFTANAQTNSNTNGTIVVNGITYAPVTLSVTNADSGKSYGGYELTLGGGGQTVNGESAFGLDLSLSTNPFKSRPEVWVGVAQSLYWEPSFAGSTDLFVDWSQPILPSLLNDKLYLNAGWSGGALYGSHGSTVWRTGPEATFQYYTSDSAFIYAGVNYDVFSSDKNEGGFRYSFGIGLTF